MATESIEGMTVSVAVQTAEGIESTVHLELRGHKTDDKFTFDIEQAQALVVELKGAISHAKAINALSKEPLKKRTGRLSTLSDKQVWILRNNGHSRLEIDCMEHTAASALVKQYVEGYSKPKEEVSE